MDGTALRNVHNRMFYIPQVPWMALLCGMWYNALCSFLAIIMISLADKITRINRLYPQFLKPGLAVSIYFTDNLLESTSFIRNFETTTDNFNKMCS